MDKYIVEIEGKNTCTYPDGEKCLAFHVESDSGKAVICTKIPLTPYTEPDMEQVRKEAYEDGYKTAKVQCNIQAEKDLREVGERHYQKGLSDAWEAARKIATMPYNEEEKAFGSGGWAFITNHTASEAIEKIRQYEQEKEEQDGLRQNIQTIVDQYGYSLDEIAEVLQKMQES